MEPTGLALKFLFPIVAWAAPWLCGIKITKPVQGNVIVGGEHIVVGKFRLTLGLHFRLFRNVGKNYWPQGSPDFDPRERTWKCPVHIGGQPGEEHTIIIAAVSSDLHDLLEHYRDVHTKLGKWVPFKLYALPTGIRELDRVNVTELATKP